MSEARVGLLEFPGSNCLGDLEQAFYRLYGIKCQRIWHRETALPPVDRILIPGGFSFGDYLRSGKLAALSPIMRAVREFALKGGPVLGICNGFQILTEAGLLPGVLLRNNRRDFICDHVELTVAPGNSPYHFSLASQNSFSLPIAHGEGRFVIDAEGEQALLDHGQVLLRYQNDVNGSVSRIAGIVSKNGRVLGLMPHPERAVYKHLGAKSEAGRHLLQSFLSL